MEKSIEDKIINVLKKNNELNILDIASKLSMDRHTVAKYLEVLRGRGLVSVSSKGKSKFWRLTNNSLTELIGKNDFISSQVLDLFRVLDFEVSIQSKNYDVVWHSSSRQKGKCYTVLKGQKTRCKNCPSEKVFETGMSQKVEVEQGGEQKILVSKPIKNESGEVIAVIELLKDKK